MSLIGVDDVIAAGLSIGAVGERLDLGSYQAKGAYRPLDFAWLAGLGLGADDMLAALDAGADLIIGDEALPELASHVHGTMDGLDADRAVWALAPALETWSFRSLLAERGRGGLGRLQHAQISVRQASEAEVDDAAVRMRSLGLLEAATGDRISAVQAVRSADCLTLMVRFAGGSVGGLTIRIAPTLEPAFRVELSGVASTRVAVYVPHEQPHADAEADADFDAASEPRPDAPPELASQPTVDAAGGGNIAAPSGPESTAARLVGHADETATIQRQRATIAAVETILERRFGRTDADAAAIDLRSAAAVDRAIETSLREGETSGNVCFGTAVDVERPRERTGGWPRAIESKPERSGSTSRVGRAGIAPRDEAVA